MVSKAQQKAVNKYVRENYDRVLVTMPKGKKEQFKAIATSKGMSLNAYILSLLEQDAQKEQED